MTTLPFSGASVLGLAFLACLAGCQRARPQVAQPPPPMVLASMVVPAPDQGEPQRASRSRRLDGRSRKDSLAAWTQRYRTKFPNQPRAFYIKASLVSEILKQTDAASAAPVEGMRLYFGLDSVGVTHVILVAVGRDGKNLLERGVVGQRGQAPLPSPVVGESADKCPSNCDLSSPLEQ